MTVIVLFESHQLAVSDALITVDDRTVSAVTPTTGDTSAFLDLKLGVSRLVRKIISADGPSGKTELLVSGTLSHIQHFAWVLNQVFRGQRTLPDELLQMVRDDGVFGCMKVAAKLADADGYKEFEVVGVAGNRMCTHTFDSIRINADIPYFGKVWIAGSGSLQLLNWLEARGERYASHFASLDEHERRFHIANNVPLFLIEEDLSPRRRTINAGVGGYYEAFDISRGALMPLDDCLTVFADIKGRNRDATLIVRRMMYHCYRGGHLYVISVKHNVVVTADGPVRVPLNECELFHVPPLQSEVTPSTWSIHRVASKMQGAGVVRTVMRRTKDGHSSTKRFVTNKPDDVRLFRLSISGNYLVAELNVEGFNHFSSRFPSDFSDVLIV